MKFGLDVEETTTQAMASPSLQMDMVTTRRSPSPTRLTPEPKRPRADNHEEDERAQAIVYTKHIPAPSKDVVSFLYNDAIAEAKKTNVVTDQAYLNPAGILSFEYVLLPALALAEEKALKDIQAKVQRDAPSKTYAIEACRRLVRRSTIQAMEATRTSRFQRKVTQEYRQLKRFEQHRSEQEARKLSLEQEQIERAERRRVEKDQTRQQRNRALQRQHPRNQELWKEIVFLTSSLTQLEKEERMWIQAEQELLVAKTSEKNATASSTSNESIVDEDDSDVTGGQLQEQVDTAIDDIILTSTRIQQGLRAVLDHVKESDRVRQQLYDKYRKDHHFHGYQGVQDPRGLIRFLSQDD